MAGLDTAKGAANKPLRRSSLRLPPNGESLGELQNIQHHDLSKLLMRWSRWWFATVCYAAMSVTLFGLAWRSYATYGRELEIVELLDPSVAYFFMGRRGIAMLALLHLMVQAIWKRMPELVLVAFALSFIGGFLEIVYFTGIQPSKIDFRPIHPAAMSQTLGWLSFACFLSGTIACLRKPRELRH